MARWVERLADFNIKLLHRPRKLNKVDPLSRNPIYGDGRQDNDALVALPDKLFLQTLWMKAKDT